VVGGSADVDVIITVKHTHKHTHTHISDGNEGQRVSNIDFSARESLGTAYHLGDVT